MAVKARLPLEKNPMKRIAPGVCRGLVCGKRFWMFPNRQLPSALRHWAGGFWLMVPLIHQMEDSTEGRINLNYSLFIFQYSLFISLQGQIPSVFAKQNSGRPVWPLRGDLGRSKTCRLPPAPPPAFEKAGPKLYFFYSLAPGVCRGIIICLPLLLFQLLQPLLPLTDPAGLDQRLDEHPQPAADPKPQ